MTETVAEAVGETTAPDANVNLEVSQADAEAKPEGNEADPSPAAKDSGEDDVTKPVRSRIDELTRNWRETQRDRDHWREIATRGAPREPVQQAAAPTDAKTLADFAYDETKFREHILSEADKRIDARFSQREAQEAEIRRNADFDKRSAKFAKTVDDFHEVTQDPSVRITRPMAEAIKDSDDGPAVAYYLGKNPDVAARIANLGALSAAREIGRIEAKLVSEREKAKDKAIVSKAPAPPPKLEAATADLRVSASDPDSDKLSTEDWLKRRNKQIASRKR